MIHRFGVVVTVMGLGCAEVPVPPPDVLLISLDTTRVDALGVYGQQPSPSPHFDRIARDGVFAAEAMSVSPLTLPSHASIMTGLYPTRHGVRDNGYVLAAEHQTLAEALKQAGYSTQAVVASVVLDRQFGLNQGFDDYIDAFDMGAAASMKGALLTHPAEWVESKAKEAISKAPLDTPLFLWTHFYDAHLPYAPRSPFKEAFPTDPYLAEINRVDAAWGRIASELKSRRARPLWIVVLADHGEGRGDHGETTHGLFVYRSTMHIPFAMHGGPVTENTVLPNPVSQVDVMPTVLAAIAPDQSNATDGLNLLGPTSTKEERMVYGETIHPMLHFGLSELRVLQNGTQRYISAPEPEVYSFIADNDELENLWSSLSEEVHLRWMEQMSPWQAQIPVYGDALRGDTMAEALDALGYLSSPPIAKATKAHVLPDPKTAPDIVHQFETVRDVARTQPPDKGALVLKSFLIKYPKVVAARLLLSEAYRLTGEVQKAHDVLLPILETDPKDPNYWIRSGELLMEGGRIDEAKEHVQTALRLNPNATGALTVLAEIYRREGDCATALEFVNSCLEGVSEDSRCLLVYAACLQRDGHWASSAVALQRAADLDPRSSDAVLLLGMAYIQMSEPEKAIAQFEKTLRLSPGHQGALAALGLAHYQSRRFSKAVQAFSQLDVQKMGLEVLLAYADSTLRIEGDTEVTRRLLQRAQSLEPKDHRVFRLWSTFSMKEGNVEEAMRFMNLARGINP